MKKTNKKGKVWKKILLFIIRNIVCLIVGLIYIMYLIIHNIDLLVAKLYSKLPRLMRVSIIYSLIICSIYGLFFNKTKVVIAENKEEPFNITFVEKEKEESVEEISIEELKCNLSEIECKIYDKAKEIGLNEEQTYMIISISKHETGNWTSKAFNNKNNLGGIMCNTGLRYYDTLEDGIDAFVNLLKNRYFDKGLDTIEKIGAVYCPIGASNDPSGVNKYWIPNVTKYFNEYLGG